jgi:RNA-directed DNA polymerase
MWSVLRRWLVERIRVRQRPAGKHLTTPVLAASPSGDASAEGTTSAQSEEPEPPAGAEATSTNATGRRRKRREGDDRRYFGEELWGVSRRHRSATHSETRVQRFGLPALRDERELAAWLGLPLARLRWFTYDRPADKTWHYVRYVVPKRNGGQRVILAPKRELKALQRKVLGELVAKIPAASAAHGFVAGRSITTNARPHVGKRVVLGLDLKDFFPSITFQRTRGVFIAHGYSYAVASTLALLCTEYDREPFDRNGDRFYISVGQRHLVQGAPTSPALANLVAWRLDRRLLGLAAKYRFSYTRYADDLTFSGDDVSAVGRLLTNIKRIVADERFVLNDAKTRVARRARRQIVTGLVVNDQVATPRQLRRRLRAILHNARQGGLEAQNRTHPKEYPAYVRGLVAFVNAVNPQQAAPLVVALRRVVGGGADRSVSDADGAD